jgi:hypothetical protein
MPESCTIHFVKSVEALVGETSGVLSETPGQSEKIVAQKFDLIPPATLAGTCCICLARLASSKEGVFITLCNHAFCCGCLANVRDDLCPVCRFSPQLACSCSVCGDEFDNFSLWMCLICGDVGCSRYENGHSLKHFHESGHAYSLHLQSQMVWDYSADEYVERLISAQADDGKLMPVPGGHARETRSGQYPSSSAEGTGSESQAATSSSFEIQESMTVSEMEGSFSVRDSPLMRMDAVNNKLEGIAMRYNHSLGKPYLEGIIARHCFAHIFMSFHTISMHFFRTVCLF